MATTRTTTGKKSTDDLAEELNKTQLKNYLDALEPGPRKILKELRELIRAAAPGATDSFSYGIPAVRYKGKSLVNYAAWKNHASLYPIAPGIKLTSEATPSLPFPPMPTGHSTVVPSPTLAFHSELTFER